MKIKDMRSGDIILAKGSMEKSIRIMRAQNVLLFFSPEKEIEVYSHAAIYVGDGLILEARNDRFKGVHISTLKQFFCRYKTEYETKWVVYRNSTFNDQVRKDISLAVEDFLTAGYNIDLINQGKMLQNNTFFCSALVVKVLRQATIPIFKGIHAKEIPPLFFTLLTKNNNDWNDVTEFYEGEIPDDSKAIQKRSEIYQELLEHYGELYSETMVNYIDSDGFNEQETLDMSKTIESFLCDDCEDPDARQAYRVVEQKVYLDIFRRINKKKYSIQWVKKLIEWGFVLCKNIRRVKKNDF